MHKYGKSVLDDKSLDFTTNANFVSSLRIDMATRYHATQLVQAIPVNNPSAWSLFDLTTNTRWTVRVLEPVGQNVFERSRFNKRVSPFREHVSTVIVNDINLGITMKEHKRCSAMMVGVPRLVLKEWHAFAISGAEIRDISLNAQHDYISILMLKIWCSA